MKSIALLVLCLLSTPVMACQFENADASPVQFFDSAKTVFTAHITKAQEIQMPAGDGDRTIAVVEAEFSTIEVFKGSPPESHKVHDLVFGYGNCSNPLLVGTDYLFFLEENKEMKEPTYEYNYVGFPTGSRMIYPIESKLSKILLQTLRTHAAELKKE